MNLVSIRVITDDVARLVDFYERLTGTTATWSTPQFAEILTPSCTLAIADTATLALVGNAGLARPAENHSVFIEFLVDDVDAEADRVRGLGELVNEPTTMPWGNRSLILRDPDGQLVNLFTPVTPEARAKFGV